MQKTFPVIKMKVYYFAINQNVIFISCTDAHLRIDGVEINVIHVGILSSVVVVVACPWRPAALDQVHDVTHP